MTSVDWRGRIAAVAVVACVAVGAAVLVHRSRDPLTRFAAGGRPIYCGGGGKREVALTFDDGPTRWTPKLVTALRAGGGGATFFEIGEKAARHPELVRLEESVGEVGDHSWSHPSLGGLPAARIIDEFAHAKRAIESSAHTRVRLVRPPFGVNDPAVLDAARRLGLVVVLWNVDSGDASAASTPPSAVVAQHVVDQARPGAIVLLHEDETVATAVDAVRLFLPVLRARGLRAVTVSELLRTDPPNSGSVGNEGACP
jgi:peptidoglycan/xylan/chitin deacetylase (PgdA/CDA1 family)